MTAPIVLSGRKVQTVKGRGLAVTRDSVLYKIKSGAGGSAAKVGGHDSRINGMREPQRRSSD